MKVYFSIVQSNDYIRLPFPGQEAGIPILYQDMADKEYGAGALENNRRISVMPLPHVYDEQIGQKMSLLCDANLSMSFISSHADASKHELLKEFLQFCYTDKSLSEQDKRTDLWKLLEDTSGKDSLEIARSLRGINVVDNARVDGVLKELLSVIRMLLLPLPKLLEAQL